MSDPPPRCDICGAQASIYWSPWYVNEGEVEAVPSGGYGILLLCSEHFEDYLRACRKWLDSQTRRSAVIEVCPRDPKPCGAQDWCEDDDGSVVIRGTCQLPAYHESRFHQEWRDGKLWAEWSGPLELAPERT